MGEVLALEELLALPIDQAKVVMLDLSKTISDQKLAEAWSTHFTLVRKLRSILGIHKNHNGTIVNVTEIQGDKWPPAFRLPARRAKARPEKVVVMQGAADHVAAAQLAEIRGLSLSIKGTYNGAELEPRIEAIRTLLLSCAGSRYAINLSLDEVIPAGAADRGLARGAAAATSAAASGEDGFYEEQQVAR
ncbi:MAG: hypothetical protein ABSC17_09365 [Thermacetogeniaceae bacterium]